MAAAGQFSFDALPYHGLGGGVRTEFGTLIPPGARVAAYVRSTGVQTGDDEDVANRLFTTLNAGLAECRGSTFGDVVVVLPGHVESISSANYMSSMVAGTKIIGLGYGTLRPTFTWTTATSTWLFNVANVSLENCILNMDPGTGTTTVAAPITVSAAGCAIKNCFMRTSTDANSLTTIPITTTAAGDYLELIGNRMYGATAGECTTMVRLVGADYLRMLGCIMIGATSSTTVGVVQCITTASTFIEVRGCTFMNTKAASVHAFTGLSGVTGVVEDCAFHILDNATLAGLVTPGSLRGARNRTSNDTGEEGAETTTQST